MSIEIKQSEKEVRPGWWKWSVWLDGPAAELDRIESVVYHLHPTFPQPEREVDDRASGFRLDGSGWGTFELGVEIRDATGKTSLRSHQLEFSRGTESKSEGPEPIPERGIPHRGASTRDDARVWYSLSKGADESDEPELGRPKSILLLHDLEATNEAEGLRQSLTELGISVADGSSVAGSSWSMELVDSIRAFDGVVTLGAEGSETMPVEAKIAQKLGKQVIMLDRRGRPGNARDLVRRLTAGGPRTSKSY